MNQKYKWGEHMEKLNDLRDLTVGLMDLNYGVNRLAEAKEGFKLNLIIMIVSNLILAAVCVGIMYLRFRVIGR